MFLEHTTQGGSDEYHCVTAKNVKREMHVTHRLNIGHTHTHTHTHSFNGPFSGTTRVSWYQKGKTNLDFIEAKDSEWQWRQLGHMQVCTSLQFLHQFLQAECPSCRRTNSVKALKEIDSTSNA